MFAVIDDDLSVHQHVIDAYRIDKRLLISSSILNRVVVEDDDVGPTAFADHAARLQTHPCRGPRGHLADRLLERQHSLFPNIARDETRKVAIAARVTETERVYCVRIQRRGGV